MVHMCVHAVIFEKAYIARMRILVYRSDALYLYVMFVVLQTVSPVLFIACEFVCACGVKEAV